MIAGQLKKLQQKELQQLKGVDWNWDAFETVNGGQQ